MGRNKRLNYIDNERYRRNVAGSERAFMPDISGDRQSLYERFYMKRLKELSIGRFKWINLPVSTSRRFLETTLLQYGLAVCFLDTEYTEQIHILRGTPSGHFNPTDDPTRFTVTGNNFPGRQLSARDCVPIWANDTRTSDMDLLYIYANRLATLDTTIDINGRNARRTRVAFADENQRMSAVAVNRQIDNGDPVVYLDSGTGLTPTALTSYDFGIQPKTLEELHILKVRLWNELMMYMGIQGANQDKKERLVASEVDANSEQIDLNREVALGARKLACTQINRKYNLNVDVEFVTQTAAVSPIEGA